MSATTGRPPRSGRRVDRLRRSRRRTSFLVVVGLTAAVLAVGWRATQAEWFPTRASDEVPSAAPTPIRVVGDPVRLRIPDAAVDAAFEPLAIGPDGVLAAPVSTDGVGWSVDGPEPGEVGTAVIAGHLDSTRTGPAVFAHLPDLEPGAVIEVDEAGGATVRFVVDRVEQHGKDAVPVSVYEPTPTPSLRLITCGGEFDRSARHYQDNVVVFASPVV